jgi:hypothetical protein
MGSDVPARHFMYLCHRADHEAELWVEDLLRTESAAAVARSWQILNNNNNNNIKDPY